jgi:hypothetical protein
MLNMEILLVVELRMKRKRPLASTARRPPSRLSGVAGLARVERTPVAASWEKDATSEVLVVRGTEA